MKDYFKTQKGVKLVKDTFEKKLAEKLSLIRVSAPRFLKVGKGLQDDLAGTQTPVSFSTKFCEKVEIVHSLAKWKRWTLGKHGFRQGAGLYTDMDAIRKDEDVSPIHSIYVDQWDWEKVISKEDRTEEFLRKIVKQIFSALKETESLVESELGIKSTLPEKISFIDTQEMEIMLPDLSPKEREHEVAKKFGAVFIKGIGGKLESGKSHDLRAADYDDWTLDGDILVWDTVRQSSMELSSMGIRVDKKVLLRQLKESGLEERKELEYHKAILEDKVPLSIGGGIGQSRMCMFLLQKKHIKEVQESVWPE